jgi:hypothetical protein
LVEGLAHGTPEIESANRPSLAACRSGSPNG